ncbi:MAG: N-acetylmuramic acid 6-phosphate etherase [Thermotoga caldifontis]|uniref:N-acetylmuramic acid 6-phosphate etherase n=1 Tax=Pseudothermotoga hypogea DSM 11164 = NBRC 106472 TaxID=1123384 RepID=A0A0X1KQU7_9THEM|nr:N-acetylmuramic acid 6-phosphate etherase [Pseudothermotoga hypogea]AJC73685.1 N-acetylmuramic acid-6-phosphate etherase [Pseudothermotoga hypogea DSM 11164 = NBRC 106472]
MNENRTITEMRNPKSQRIDEKSVGEILRIINEEDALVALAVREALPQIEKLVEVCVETLNSGGRVFYVGAGTSGRIAFMDAVELVPTYGLEEGIFVPIIAGGFEALRRSIEGVEDLVDEAQRDLMNHDLQAKDLVIGIAASGSTPYVRGALIYARQLGCKTALICNVNDPPLAQFADIVVSVVTGPEVIAGSTRMKAGTAQKMVLNMLSTTVMIKLGKVYDNLMVDVLVLNEKLRKRAINIVTELTGVDEETAKIVLEKTSYSVKLAVLHLISKKDLKECQRILSVEPSLRKALTMLGG